MINIYRSILYLILLTISLVSTRTDARDFVAESARYQQEWKPSTIELVVDDLVLDESTSDKLSADEKAAITRLPSLLRTAISTYTNEFGLAVSFVPLDKPCGDPGATTRIVISPHPRELKVERMPASAPVRVVTLPVQVSSPADCSHRPDNFTSRLDITLPDSLASGLDKKSVAESAFLGSIRKFSQNVIDEMLLIWYPSWSVPKEDPKPFTSFALQPIFPAGSTGFSLKALKASNRGFNGLVITPIETAKPLFQWTPLEELAERGSNHGTSARISEIRYEFRLHAPINNGLGMLPGKELLHRVDITEPTFNLPTALESCQTYFWTVRARFRLNGFPRVTEWTELHNSVSGLVAPWVFRRGENTWLTGWNSAWTYPAFRTPSAIGGHKCP